MGRSPSLMLRGVFLVIASLSLAGGVGLVVMGDPVNAAGGLLAGAFFAVLGLWPPARQPDEATGREWKLVVLATLMTGGALVYLATSVAVWPSAGAVADLGLFAFLLFAAMVMGKNSNRRWRVLRLAARLPAGGAWAAPGVGSAADATATDAGPTEPPPSAQ